MFSRPSRNDGLWIKNLPKLEYNGWFSAKIPLPIRIRRPKVLIDSPVLLKKSSEISFAKISVKSRLSISVIENSLIELNNNSLSWIIMSRSK